MSSQASFIDIPVAKNVQQVLAFDDQSFVYCAYRTLLRRDADDVGMTYYLGRLRGGENKMQLLKELHSSAEGRRVGATVDKNDLRPGDLVFYNTLRRGFSHVGIYLGDNKFVHSPSAGSSIRIESMDLGYWKKRFNGARRISDPEQN